MSPVPGIEARLARTPAEIDAAQRLRYHVFYEEWGAIANKRQRLTRRDADEHDARMDHLIVIDHGRCASEGQVIGTYRLKRREPHARADEDGCYSGTEFDLSPLLASGERTLELGRSCVLREYRNRAILQLLWRAIAEYVADHGIGLMFGCASLHGTDPMMLREQLAYLHHFHLAPRHLRPRAIGPNSTRMDLLDKSWIDPRRAMAKLEPLIKGYLRLGASVGDGAYIDRAFNSVDVCIVMLTEQLTRRYLAHYERTLDRSLLPTGEAAPTGMALTGST